MTGDRPGTPTASGEVTWRGVEPGRMAVSASVTDVLRTIDPVGSCVAVCLWDPVSGVAGMLHFLWPDSKHDPAKAGSDPAAFADTGLPVLLEQATRMGADTRRCKVRLVGGAHTQDREESERWAKRNVLAARSALWRSGVFIDGEEVGGTRARRAALAVASGRLSITFDEPAAG